MKSLSDRPPAHSEENQSDYEAVIIAKQNHKQKNLSGNRSGGNGNKDRQDDLSQWSELLCSVDISD
ncbi:hypothetical protein Lepto7375DRAFT_8321 [Leptolyngbya sp. PCC 7375]|nr:hypothetical protein Lepto7375DRAFT_8321 [Leptolyngbya sp. PCC 7375]